MNAKTTYVSYLLSKLDLADTDENRTYANKHGKEVKTLRRRSMSRNAQGHN